jgi:N6-adenosine-specific RNA methylase IME4
MDEINRKYHEVANIFPLMQGDEFEALKNDIAEYGQREPIWLHQDGSIIDGRNRHRACCELDISPKFNVWDGNGSLVQFVVSLNLHRRHLTSSQLAMIGVDIAFMLEEEAKEKELARKTTFQKFEKSNMQPINSTERAATIVGSNRQYISDAKRIVQQAPEVAEMVRSGEITITEAKSLTSMDDGRRSQVVQMIQTKEVDSAKDAIRLVAKQEKAAIAKAAATLPQKEYNVIYVDPPWEYSNTGVHGAAAHHYNTMSIDELRELPHKTNLKIANNAVMFMWITNPLMAEAFSLIEDWGFTYKTNMVWIKTELKKPGSGFYVRGRHELLFICTRGSFTPIDENISPPIGSVIEAPIQEHSRKPEEFYKIIERLYPDCSYIELFARSKRDGWDTWGNETDKFSS